MLPVWILFFTCSFLYGSENFESEDFEDPYPVEYRFYENADCMKIKITHPKGIEAIGVLTKVRSSPGSEGVTVIISNKQLKRLEDYYQLVDMELHAISSPEKGGVTFELISRLERKPMDSRITRDMIINSETCFVETDRPLNFRDDVMPKLTGSANSSNIQYVRFFTNP